MSDPLSFNEHPVMKIIYTKRCKNLFQFIEAKMKKYFPYIEIISVNYSDTITSTENWIKRIYKLFSAIILFEISMASLNYLSCFKYQDWCIPLYESPRRRITFEIILFCAIVGSLLAYMLVIQLPKYDYLCTVILNDDIIYTVSKSNKSFSWNNLEFMICTKCHYMKKIAEN